MGEVAAAWMAASAEAERGSPGTARRGRSAGRVREEPSLKRMVTAPGASVTAAALARRASKSRARPGVWARVMWKVGVGILAGAGVFPGAGVFQAPSRAAKRS